MAFYENFVDLCNSIRKSPTATVEAMGFNRSTLTGWKKGTTPSDATVRRIADYFGISVADLLADKTEDSKTATKAQAADPKADDLCQEFARLFTSLSPENQNKVIAEMLKRQREQ